MIRLFFPSLAVCIVFGISSASAQQTSRPETIVGRDACKKCHATEYAAWERSSHNTKAWAALDHPKAAEFAKAIGVSNPKSDSACTQCHGTHMSVGGSLKIEKGNSCESCHGGAGGNAGWLDSHADYGLGHDLASVTMSTLLRDRAKESDAHRATRDASTSKARMKRASDSFDLAANCLNCHTVPNEKLVEAGHPISARFEYVEWSQGEVRHNFLLSQDSNAEVSTNWSDAARHGKGRTDDGHKRLMRVSGQLADLAISLKNRATVTSTKRGSLGDEMNDRILDLKEEIEEYAFPELKPAIAALANFDKKSLREVTANDKTIYRKAAGAMVGAGRAFVNAYQDGTKLPKSVDVPSKAKGEVYKQ